MRNLEIKARCPDLDRARRTALSIQATPTARGEQTDTYFDAPPGRMKLRESSFDNEAKLIYYRRADSPGPSACDYRMATLRHPRKLVEVIAKHYGERVVVRKHREVFTWNGARINLDDVAGVGTFIEFEVPAEESEEEAERIMTRLLEAFGVSEEDLVAQSYSDLVCEREAGT